MDTNLILTLIGLAITIIAGVGGLIISLFSKISKLEGRLDTLASENRLQDKIDKIHDESIRKLQQRATELHDTTQTQLDHFACLMAEIVQQRAQVKQEIEQEVAALRQEKVKTRLASLEGQVERLKDAGVRGKEWL